MPLRDLEHGGPGRWFWRAIILLIAAAILLGGTLGLARQRQFIHLEQQNATAIHKVNIAIRQLQTLEKERGCTNRAQLLVFAAILYDLADAFDAPPAPNQRRTDAVNGLRATADGFVAQAYSDAPPPCPAHDDPGTTPPATTTTATTLGNVP